VRLVDDSIRCIEIATLSSQNHRPFVTKVQEAPFDILGIPSSRPSSSQDIACDTNGYMGPACSHVASVDRSHHNKCCIQGQRTKVQSSSFFEEQHLFQNELRARVYSPSFDFLLLQWWSAVQLVMQCQYRYSLLVADHLRLHWICPIRYRVAAGMRVMVDCSRTWAVENEQGS